MNDTLDIVIIGLTITSSWGNGHATTYRGLVRETCALGHDVLFLERDVPWYAGNRDLPEPPYGRTVFYGSLAELKEVHRETVRKADIVIVGSCVPEGIAVCDWVLETATGIKIFYDIDTPITLATMEQGKCEYLEPRLIPRFDVYLSFTGGPVMEHIERDLGARLVRPLYCSVDEQFYKPLDIPHAFDLGYMGTYSEDRQPALERLLIEPARRHLDLRFMVAGPMYPEPVKWPQNVTRIDHLAPDGHPAFYNSQRFTLNITRADMLRAGWSPSGRLFEAAACGVPIISDWWDGLDSFFTPGSEILIANSPEDTIRFLTKIREEERSQIADHARRRVLAENTARRRAHELEQYVREAMGARSAR